MGSCGYPHLAAAIADLRQECALQDAVFLRLDLGRAQRPEPGGQFILTEQSRASRQPAQAPGALRLIDNESVPPATLN